MIQVGEEGKSKIWCQTSMLKVKFSCASDKHIEKKRKKKGLKRVASHERFFREITTISLCDEF